MGNETSIFKKCNVSCKPRYQTSVWSLFDATQENQSFSAFIFNDNEFCNDFTKWKHVRHPYLVKVYEAGIYKNKKYILTEPVIPIRQFLHKFHQFCKLSGLYNIGDALSFLHQICNISVNNLSIDSIFISKNDPNELWKLGSLYWCSSLNTEDKKFAESLISFHTHNETLNILPPEDRDIKNPTLIGSLKEIHRRDVYAFVNIINELFNNVENPKLSEILIVSDTETNNYNLMVKNLIENFNSFNFDQRPTISAIRNNHLFQNCPFVQLRQFFSNFSTYNDQEKYSFLKVLIENLRQFSDQSLVVNIFIMIVSSRFIMSNRLIYNHVMPYFLIPTRKQTNDNNNSLTDETDNSQSSENKSSENSYVLTNGETITLSPFISIKTFRDNILPHIINLYCVHDYKIRLLLLQYLPHYGSFISKTCLKKVLLPQILLGIKDSDKELVSLTFRSVAVLIDLFGVVTVLGGYNRRKYFTSGVSNQNSHIDRKKSNIYTSTDKIDSMIFERSSPDGDETRESNILVNENSNIKFLNATIQSSDDEWPEWEESNTTEKKKNIVCSEKMVRNVKIAETVSSNEKEKLQTFDIKEIDFKEVAYNKEIDNLFMDMAPVLNFRNKNSNSAELILINTKCDIKDTKENSPHKVDTSLFEDKNELNIQDIENSGWNDSLDWNDVNGTDSLDTHSLEQQHTDEVISIN